MGGTYVRDIDLVRHQIRRDSPEMYSGEYRCGVIGRAIEHRYVLAFVVSQIELVRYRVYRNCVGLNSCFEIPGGFGCAVYHRHGVAEGLRDIDLVGRWICRKYIRKSSYLYCRGHRVGGPIDERYRAAR